MGTILTTGFILAHSQENLPDNRSTLPVGAANSKSKSRSRTTTTLKSTKSASGTRRPPRLFRTLKRKPTFHTIEEDDMKWLYAAYKLGSFSDNDLVNLERGMDAVEFDKQLRLLMTTYYDNAWVMESVNEGKRRRVGMLFSVLSGPFHLLGDVTWFPWATDRNKVETIVHFLNESRKENLMMWYCSYEDKRFYDHIARHGIIKRVGKISDLFEGGDVPFWQTRK